MKKVSIKEIATVLKKTCVNWYKRDPFKESSVIAFNAIFSLPGLLVIVIVLAGYFFGPDAVNGRMHKVISKAMGNSAADQIQEIIIMAIKSRNSVLATVFGITTIVLGATSVFIQLQKSFNIIWEVKTITKRSGIKTFLKTRLFSFSLIISIGFLLLISMVITTLLSALSNWVMHYWSESFLILFHVLNFVFSLSVITLLFAIMFKILPDAKIKWKLVWIGAFVTSLLFVIGKTALGYYFGKVNPGSIYGAAGSIILILLWTSYSSMIVFFGAEFTKAYSDLLDSDIKPTEIAVKEKGRIK